MYQSSSAVPVDYDHTTTSSETLSSASAGTASQEQSAEAVSTTSAPVRVPGRHVAVPSLLVSFCKCAGRAFTPDPYEPQMLQLFSPDKQHLRLTLPASSSALLGERMCVDEYTESGMIYVIVGCTTAAIKHYRSTGSCDGLVVTLEGQDMRRVGLISREGRIRRGGVRLSDADAMEQALKLCCELRFDHDTDRKCDESGQRLEHYRMDRFAGFSLLSDYQLEHNGRGGLKEVHLIISPRFVEYLIATGSMSRRHPLGFILDDRIFGMRRHRGGRGANHLWRIARWAILQLNLHATALRHGSTDDPICRREVDNLLKYCPELKAQLQRYLAARKKKQQGALLLRLLREVGEALDLAFIPYKNKEDNKDMLAIIRVDPANAGPDTAPARDHHGLDGARSGLDGARSGLDGARSGLDGARSGLDGARSGLDGARSGLDGARRRINSSHKRKNRRRRRS